MTGSQAERDYDAMGADYAEATATGPFNALYERPATLALLGAVRGLTVLDLGCGPGVLSRELVARGATVTGIDVSDAMLRLARETAPGAAFQLCDLAGGLPFPDGSFDRVVASLMLHYLEDWEAPLREMGRVLRGGGAIILSTHHPTMDWHHFSPDDYFARRPVTDTWVKGGTSYQVHFFRRPLTAMSEAIAASGLVIERIVEPQPLAEMAASDPDAHRRLSTEPCFLFLRLVHATGTAR